VKIDRAPAAGKQIPRESRPWITPKALCRLLHEHRFETKAGRRPGQEDVSSHYRKGVSGDWRNYFENVHVQHFHKRYPGVVEKLGYDR
jgi:hypothetical protein